MNLAKEKDWKEEKILISMLKLGMLEDTRVLIHTIKHIELSHDFLFCLQ